MKPTLSLLTAIPLVLTLTAPPRLVLAPAGTQLRFAPEPGTELGKVFLTRGSFSEASVDIEVSDDEDVPEVVLSGEWQRRVEVGDAYLKIEDGAPLELHRTYDEVGQELEYELEIDAGDFHLAEDRSGTRPSALEGETVSFTWDAEEEVYRKAFVEDGDGDGGDEDLLQGLAEDMDLRTMLPDDEVSEGDSWDLDGEALISILAPGGDLSFELEMEGEPRTMQVIAAGLDPAFLADLDQLVGKVEEIQDLEVVATFKGTREEDGVRVAVVALEVELETERDVIEAMDELLEPIREELPDIEITEAQLLFELDAKGELLWDLSAGHLHSFELEGAMAITLERRVLIDAGGEEVEISMILELEGELSHSVTRR